MNENNKTMTVSAIIMIIVATAATPVAQVVLAQEMFESGDGTYRLQVPEGWVVQDVSTVGSEEELTDIIETYGSLQQAYFCKEDEALPALGGAYDCVNAQTTGGAVVTLYPDLQSRPEFHRLLEEENKTATTSDLVAIYINNSGGYDFRIENNTDIDESRKIIHAQFQAMDDAGTILPLDDFVLNWGVSALFVLSPDKNTGYSLVGPPIYNYTIGGKTEYAVAMEQMFNTFQIAE